MQTVLRPWQSSAHRLASIALYRTLLSQCGKLADETQKLELRNVVRNAFRANRRINGHKLLRSAFASGYEVVNILDNAVQNDQESLAEIDAILDEASPREKCEPPLTPPQQRDRYPPKGPTPGRFNDPHGILSRPRPINEETLTKPRKVPKLFVAGRGMPFLRIKKPQPPLLSAAIRRADDKNFTRTKQLDYLHDIIQPLANNEDTWDVILEEMFGLSPLEEVLRDSGKEIDDVEEMFPTWYRATTYGIIEINKRLTEDTERYVQNYYKLVSIVEKEKELAEEEARILQARRESNDV